MAFFFGGPKKKHRICIVGGGFSGLHAAQYFKPEKYEVTVIDPQPFIEWLPNIHEVLSGMKKGDELRLPRQPVIERLGHTFRMEKVTDISANSLTTEWGKVLPFDACIVCTGNSYDLQQVPGANQFTFPFKSVESCQQIAKRLHRGTLSSRVTRVTVVGSGLGGVEVLGEVLRAYRARPQFEFQVVSPTQKMLENAPSDLEASIRHHTRRLPMEYHLGNEVDTVDREGLVLTSGRLIESDVTIWTGGAAPRSGKVQSESSQWGKVNEFLQSQHSNVFVVGDAAQFDDKVIKQAFHAVEMGRLAAENAERFLTDKPLKSYKPSHRPQLVTFGDLDTFMLFDDFAISSSLLGAVKEVLFTMGLLQMAPPRNAKDVMRHLDILQRSVRNVYLPTINPMAILDRWPKARIFRN
ncbi:predicted oxidoreductase [gamma proteobacterium HdN1]|nr:predicted oxidoreductase [gamma proteobacterium HdN1]